MSINDDGEPDAPVSLAEGKRRQRAKAKASKGAADEIGPNDVLVHPGDLPKTARDVRDRLARLPDLFERSGAPVRVYIDADDRLAMHILTEFDIVNVVHENFHVKQWRISKDGEDAKLIPVTLPQRVARLYLAMVGTFGLRPLVGVTDAPLLSNDGTILMGAK